MTNKDLIAQYVDTGLRLPEYQVSQLSNWAKKTYIRKRLIKINSNQDDWMDNDELGMYEVKLLEPSDKKKYLEEVLGGLSPHYDDTIDYEYMAMMVEFPDLLEKIIDIGFNLGEEETLLMPIEYRKRYLEKMIDAEIEGEEGIGDMYLKLSLEIPELLEKILTSGLSLDEKMFLLLSSEDKIRYLLNRTSKSEELEDFEINLIPKIPFNDSTINDSMIFYILQMGDKGVKILMKRLSENKLAEIFSNLERWMDSDELEPIGKKMALKYGAVDDDRPTYEEVYDELVKEENYYGEDDTNKNKFIEFFEIEEPLPSWAEKVGYYYNDSENETMFGLSREQALSVAKKKIPIIFDLKK